VASKKSGNAEFMNIDVGFTTYFWTLRFWNFAVTVVERRQLVDLLPQKSRLSDWQQRTGNVPNASSKS